MQPTRQFVAAIAITAAQGVRQVGSVRMD